MSNDRTQDNLLTALRLAMAEPGEQRLFKSGKLAGLFSGKTSLNTEVASHALREGYLEIVRTETKGKTPVEWVRVTPKGVDFVLSNESPVRALDELRNVLQANQEGLPTWVTQLRNTIQEIGRKLEQEVETIGRRLEILGKRVEEAIKRAQSLAPRVPEGAAQALPWSQDLLDYLERRQDGQLPESCPMPEAFARLRETHPDLAIKDYHSGLRRLHDRGVLRLLPFEGPSELPEPEYALLDGARVLYFVAK